MIRRFGDAGVLEFTTTERPQPRLHDAVVKIHAVGINPLDWKTREGVGLWDDHLERTGILGWDISGTVVACGRRVGEFSEGDEVFGLANYPDGGAYAEYVRVPVDQLVKKPSTVEHTDAAAVPIAGLAAYQALFDVGKVTAARRVLIHGAAGGVGHFAVQLAKQTGAQVLGTSSERNLEFVRSLGADEVIDYAAVRFEQAINAVDVVIDTVGGDVTERSLNVLMRHGVVVALAGSESSGTRKTGIGAHRVRTLALRPDKRRLDHLASLLGEGALRPSTTTIRGLRGIPDAHRISETGHVRGKVVVLL
ncbi:MAG: NADP-dependent oxidoreductase [Spirochaetota bacterium]